MRLCREVLYVKSGTASVEAMKQSPWGGMALVERDHRCLRLQSLEPPLLPYTSPAQINIHRIHRAAQSSSLPDPPRSVVLCALCASVVLFPYTTGYCLMLPPLRLTATNSTEPLNPLFSLTLKGLSSSVRSAPLWLGQCIAFHHGGTET